MVADRVRNELEHGRRIAGAAGTLWGRVGYAAVRRIERRVRVLRSEAGLAPGRRAVEIGCGIGSFTRHLAETGATLVAVDLVPELLAQARASTPASNVLFVQGDCTRLDDIPEARAADAVVGNAVLHHLDVRPALESVFRVLVPGGVLALFEPNLVNPQIFVFKHTPMLRRRAGWSPDETAFTRWRLARDVRAAGFTDVRVRPFDFLHPSTPRLLVGAVERLGLFVEKVPLLRELSGSLAVFARKPVAPVV